MTDPTITDADRNAAKMFIAESDADFEELAALFSFHRNVHTAPLEARVQELEEALRPFARMGEMADFAFAPALFHDRDSINHLPWRDNDEEVTITYGDIRLARKALEGRGS